jgi:hypothetical protein
MSYNSNIAVTRPEELPEYLTCIEALFFFEIDFNAFKCNSEISLPVPNKEPLIPETTIE